MKKLLPLFFAFFALSAEAEEFVCIQKQLDQGWSKPSKVSAEIMSGLDLEKQTGNWITFVLFFNYIVTQEIKESYNLLALRLNPGSDIEKVSDIPTSYFEIQSAYKNTYRVKKADNSACN